jgi:NADPH:quinone reductase-like Zn-dependent oxidoreductase
MRAIVNTEYCTPDRLELREIECPSVGADDVLVSVRAASVNPTDWHHLRGEPYVTRVLGGGFRRPKQPIRGVDVAGVVEIAGANVTDLRAGDEVFGARVGSFADYVCGPADGFAPKPARLTFEEAAAIPVAGITALQAVRDHGALEPGQRVLVNGAAGGVGTFAVQIARALGGEVTGVCSRRNVELVRSLGADAVDYAVEDFARLGRRYDLIVDTVGNRSLSALRRALAPTGRLVIVGGKKGNWVAPLLLPLKAVIVSRFVDQQLGVFVAKPGREDLLVLTELVDEGKLAPVVERIYALDEAPEAIRHVETGHARGKVVVRVATPAVAVS